MQIEQERFAFQYTNTYRQQNRPPLSLIFPLREAPYPDNQVFPFFENLLPEGAIRQLLAKTLNTSDNHFSQLLAHCGGEMAGAIRLLPTDSPSTDEEAPLSPALDPTTLGQVLTTIRSRPFLANPKSGMRLSLAGAQNKLPVLIDAQGMYLPSNKASTHILKPQSERFVALAENEYI